MQKSWGRILSCTGIIYNVYAQALLTQPYELCLDFILILLLMFQKSYSLVWISLSGKTDKYVLWESKEQIYVSMSIHIDSFALVHNIKFPGNNFFSENIKWILYLIKSFVNFLTFFLIYSISSMLMVMMNIREDHPWEFMVKIQTIHGTWLTKRRINLLFNLTYQA